MIARVLKAEIWYFRVSEGSKYTHNKHYLASGWMARFLRLFITIILKKEKEEFRLLTFRSFDS